MNYITKILRIVKNPLKLIRPLGSRGLLNWIPDKVYLKLIYYCETGKKLNLLNPITFNEKIQWLKLYDRRPEYTSYVDKYLVRDYVKNSIGEQYLIPLIAKFDSVDEIDWISLPSRFVLKCTHGSGCNIICNDKEKLDIDKVKKQLKQWMKKNWFWFGREWPYKNIKPSIICEKYMVDESGIELKDYKVFCFNGKPKLIQVDYNRFVNHKRNLYDIKWNYINASIKYPTDSSFAIKKPDKLEEMLKLAEKLAKNYPHVRVDFYNINGKIYFGEMTFYHGSGFEEFHPSEIGKLFGNWIKLPFDNKLNI